MNTRSIASSCFLFIFFPSAIFAQGYEASYFPPLSPVYALGFAAGGSGAASGAVSGTTASETAAPDIDAASGATPPPPSAGFLGFRDEVAFHKCAGWTSGGLLLAAGLVGAIRAYTLMNDGHAYRDAMGIDDESSVGSLCSAEISDLWGASGGQTLRWVHVGLLAAGESLYLADAVTGLGFMGPLPPGYSRSKVHRYLFFAHAGLHGG